MIALDFRKTFKLREIDLIKRRDTVFWPAITSRFLEKYTKLRILDTRPFRLSLGMASRRLMPIGSLLALVADALGEGPGALAGDVHEVRIAGDLVEQGHDPLRFRQ